MTALEKLNYVLEKSHHQKDYLDTIKELEKDIMSSTDRHNIKLILNKLHRDGYLDFIAGERYITGQQASEGLSIRRNFDGDLFLDIGGYVGEENRRITRETNEKAYNDRMETYTSRLAVWTERLTYGTIGAACIIVGWEIIKTFWIE